MKTAPKLKTLKSEAIEPKYEDAKNRKYDPRPCIQFSEDELPQIKKWPLEGKYKLTVEVEMKGIREESYGSNKGKIVGEFRVTKVGVEEDD